MRVRAPMYFNRHGELVVSVDLIDDYIRRHAKTVDNPDAFVALDNLADKWVEDISAMLVMAMEAREQA